MKIRCGALDDMEFAVRQIAYYIEKTEDLELVLISTSPNQTMKEILDNHTFLDVLFIDIDMPELSGIKVSQKLSDYCLIVFTTGHREYAAESFNKDIDAVDYLLKPITYDRFLQAIAKVKRRMGTTNLEVKNNEIIKSHILIPGQTKSSFDNVSTDEILYIEGASNYTFVNGNSWKKITHLSLSEFENKLSPQIFMRVHKSFIVNLKQFKTYQPNSFKMANGAEVPIGVSYRKVVWERLRR